MRDYSLTELDSGVRVITERIEGVRSAAIGFWIGAGSRDERAARAGVTHFIEHLLFKGTPRYSAEQIAQVLANAGNRVVLCEEQFVPRLAEAQARESRASRIGIWIGAGSRDEDAAASDHRRGRCVCEEQLLVPHGRRGFR